MEKKINKNKFRGFVAFGLFLGIFGVLIYTAINDNEKTSSVPLAEYNNLFTQEAQTKLKLLVTTTSRNRETTSSYIYDKIFNVFVFKVKLSSNSGLRKIVSYQNKTSYIFMNAVYSGLPSFNFDMDIKSGKSVLVSSVHLKSSGDFLKSVVKNDSLVCYYYKFNTFSINYNDEPYDIIAKAKQPNIPASIIFKTKGKFLYIILMTIAEGTEEMQADQLYSIISK
jgi:hypothetical protein